MNSPTEAYEQCGGWDSPDSTLKLNDPTDQSKGYYLSTPDAKLVFPKSAFKNAKEFYNNWNQAGIPFFENMKI